MPETQRRSTRASDALMAAARRELGLSEHVTDGDVLRAALAHAAREDVAAHTPRRGRPAGVRTEAARLIA